MTIPTPENLPILLIFDIDETLIQFINNSRYKPTPYEHWKNITPKQRNSFLNLWDEDTKEYKNPSKLPDDKIYYLEKNTKNAQLFRPGLYKFIQKVNSDPRIFIALWTLSDTEYAEGILNSLIKQFHLKKEKCVFAAGADGSDEYDTKPNKRLDYIWNLPKYKHRFNKFNTILIDDRLGNVNHKINQENSILIEEFAPFGPKKEREPLTDELLRHALDDKAFTKLSTIIDKVLSYNSGCDEDECNDAFFSEPVFPMKNKNKLKKLGVTSTIINEIPLITIGDVHNSSNTSKGGKKRTYKRSNTNKRTNKIKSQTTRNKRKTKRSKKYRK
jgi:hypothetical protein